MPTVFFNLKVTWPTVTNDIRVSVYDASDLNTPIAAQQQNQPHLDQQFSFPGLPRINFVYKIQEYSINGNTFISNLGQANFVPANDELMYKDSVLIEVGVTEIPGTSTTTDASTIEQNYDGNPTSSSWAFTLMGTVQEGASVEVEFSWDDGGGTQSNSVTSEVLPGWDLADLIADLLSQIVAINVNALAYTDVDGHDGVRVRGLTEASGTVTITNTTGGTTGVIWPANVNTVNVPDWIGWELEASGRPGVYPWRRDINRQIDINWNPLTGDLTLLTEDDVFQPGEFLYFEFAPIINQSSGGIPSGGGGSGWSEILVVTANTTLTESDIGKKILIIPSGNYLEITLPDFTEIEANRITWFEMDQNATQKCALIKCATGQNFTWREVMSEIEICNNESFELYKRVVATDSYQWRIQNAVGNYLDAGDLFYSDATVFNAIEATGANLHYQQYARLYNRRVIRGGDGIPYASWSSANIYTRMKFSLKETSGNNFRIPDLNTTPVYMRPRGINSATDYIPQKLLQHQHAASSNLSASRTVTAWGYYHAQVDHIGKYTGESLYYPDMTSRAMAFSTATGLWEIVDGTENNPNSRVSRLYIKV